MALINPIKKVIFVQMLIKEHSILNYPNYIKLLTKLCKGRTALFFIIVYLTTFPCFAQPDIVLPDYNKSTGVIDHDSLKKGHIVITDIIINGNIQTRDEIILREIEYAIGDTIHGHRLQGQLLWIKNRIFNTTLFLWVDISISGDHEVNKVLYIHVKERHYVIPMPTGGLIDRNFNEWYQDRHHDLTRIYYGLNLKVRNLWGLNHTLKLKAITGFNKRVETNYIIPYINKRLKTGMVINALMEFNSLVAYRSYHHKLQYEEFKGSVGRAKYNIGFMLTRRNKFYIQHQLGPYFQYTSIADTIRKLNPDYLLSGANYQRSLGLKYIFTYDKRDFINYPLKGNFFKIEADYQYLNSIKTINTSSLRMEYTQFIPFNKRIFFAYSVRGKISAPEKQPYFSQRGLGYNKEWVSGYERYVIDGQSFGLVKTNLKWRLFSINRVVKFVPHHKFRTIPLSTYLKLYADAGFVNDNTYNPNNNFLSNRLLTGGGIGLDFVTYYDLVARIEYSINGLGQTGIYINMKAGL